MISGAKMHRTPKSAKFILMRRDYFVQLWERALVAASRFRKLTKSKSMICSKTLVALILMTALGFIAGSMNAQIIT